VRGRLLLAGAFLEEAETRGRFARYPTTHEKEWAILRRVKAAPNRNGVRRFSPWPG
jgi:hypothetical protein